MCEVINIALLDDDSIFRQNLRNLLAHQDGICVVGTAENGADALLNLNFHKIDVVLIDVDMPVLDGVNTAKLLAKNYPELAIIMLTAFDHKESLSESLSTGVRGFLTKDIRGEQLATLIKQAHAGFQVLSPEPTRIMRKSYIERQRNIELYSGFADAIATLPRYLYPVFELLIKAKSNKEISKELHLSAATVRSYIAEIYSHTGINNRGELAVTAIKAGF
ncbi:response regulator transcription factor [Corynebacterium caspium]|uniref:response regulator transcription factor n=1 Tax=Corynebacterium caspium TaxID=234828 RepID=UPI0003616CC4|nr:response regulator transcription factor [Corynebacterium caspium]WKD58455.1 Transcriptional regulatory protein DegU [Corynebacterium caspium DSM 44850]